MSKTMKELEETFSSLSSDLKNSRNVGSYRKAGHYNFSNEGFITPSQPKYMHSPTRLDSDLESSQLSLSKLNDELEKKLNEQVSEVHNKTMQLNKVIYAWFFFLFTI
jgi:hypothetical protein